MGACFHGQDHSIYTTNGGFIELMRALITLGERIPQTPDLVDVITFLRECFESGFCGCGGFDFNPPPEQIATPKRLHCLAQLVIAFAVEVSQAQPDSTLTEINWDRELRIRWLANLFDLHEIINSALEPSFTSLEPLELNLALSDKAACELERLMNKKKELRRRTRASLFKPQPQVVLEQIDRMLVLIEQNKLPEAGNLSKSMLYVERAELLDSLNDKYGELVAWQQAALSESDVETRAILEEIVVDLEIQLNKRKRTGG
jgi:hypothetical protein